MSPGPPSTPALPCPAPDDYKLATDKGMAADVVSFIREWRKLFPRLAKAPFWLAGESYAGGPAGRVVLIMPLRAGQKEAGGKDCTRQQSRYNCAAPRCQGLQALFSRRPLRATHHPPNAGA